MKIIAKDNRDRDTVSDTLIATGLSKFYAEKIAKLLNGWSGGDSSEVFYSAVKDDYELYKFKP